MLLIEQVILSQVLQVVSVLWLQDKLGGCLSGCLVQLVSNNNKKKHHLSSWSATRATTLTIHACVATGIIIIPVYV